MAIKIDEDGTVYYTCPSCGSPQSIDPEGMLVCTKCTMLIPIFDIDKFVDNHNKTTQALTSIPRLIQESCYQLIGKPTNAETSRILEQSIEARMQKLVQEGLVEKYQLTFNANRNGSIECDFVMPAMLTVMNLEFGID